uniref:Acid-sensing ion channel 1-like n=1 Tax=Parastrongyloides trichosuri TaxID=131310 RepID=A0A0N5A3B6_PARTI
MPSLQYISSPARDIYEYTAENDSQGRRIHLPNNRVKDDVYQCHHKAEQYPPWISEIHGLGQALLSKTKKERILWWIVLFICGGVCIAMTTMVIVEYINGPTATSTTIRLVSSQQFPAITICPKVPDVLKFKEMYEDMKVYFPNMTEQGCRDLMQYFLAGNGFENMNDLAFFNASYLEELDKMYDVWSKGYEVDEFFNLIQGKYGINCEDLFYNCELSGNKINCCGQVFEQQVVMRRGLCYQTIKGLNQTEADDVGKLAIHMKAPVSASSLTYSYQPQLIVYVSDNFDYAMDFPRYYIYPNEWNRMFLTSRRIELLEHPGDCTYRIEGTDSACFVRQWLENTIINVYNCTLTYLNTIPGTENYPICNLSSITSNYYQSIQLVKAGSINSSLCIPGCHRWEYHPTLQQTPALENFSDYMFNLEVSFYNLQYESVREIYTTSIPGFMSQIGGQFGFFLGLSIITMFQVIIFILENIFKLFFSKDTVKNVKLFFSQMFRKKDMNSKAIRVFCFIFIFFILTQNEIEAMKRNKLSDNFRRHLATSSRFWVGKRRNTVVEKPMTRYPGPRDIAKNILLWGKRKMDNEIEVSLYLIL